MLQKSQHSNVNSLLKEMVKSSRPKSGQFEIRILPLRKEAVWMLSPFLPVIPQFKSFSFSTLPEATTPRNEATVIAPLGDHSSGCELLLPKPDWGWAGTVWAYSVHVIVGFEYTYTGCLFASLLSWPLWQETAVRRQNGHDKHKTWLSPNMKVMCSSLVGGQKLYLVTQLAVVLRDTLHPLPGLHPSGSEPSFVGQFVLMHQGPELKVSMVPYLGLHTWKILQQK